VAAMGVGVLTLVVAVGYWVVIAQHLGGSSGLRRSGYAKIVRLLATR
jgi:hypothetical protein